MLDNFAKCLKPYQYVKCSWKLPWLRHYPWERKLILLLCYFSDYNFFKVQSTGFKLIQKQQQLKKVVHVYERKEKHLLGAFTLLGRYYASGWETVPVANYCRCNRNQKPPLCFQVTFVIKMVYILHKMNKTNEMNILKLLHHKGNFSLLRPLRIICTFYLKHLKYPLCASIFHPLSEAEP